MEVWWEVWPPIIASWGAALVAVGFIVRQLWKASKWGRRATKAILRLAEIGDEEAWPNGSTSLPKAMTEIYDRQAQTNLLIEETNRQITATTEKVDKNTDRFEAYVVAHRADHGLTD